jgi:hypothetical protein
MAHRQLVSKIQQRLTAMLIRTRRSRLTQA